MTGPLTFLPAATLDVVADRLTGTGWAVLPGVVPERLVTGLRDRLEHLHAEGGLRRAGVGRGADPLVDASVRRDRIRWLARETPEESTFLDGMEGLRLSLNARLFLGLFGFEAHYALYPPGGFYARHRDSFRDARNRIVSVAAYLNDGWTTGDGGLLRLFDTAGRIAAEILPEAGTLAIFLSEDVEHEVTPTRRPRASVAGWFSCKEGDLPAL